MPRSDLRALVAGRAADDHRTETTEAVQRLAAPTGTYREEHARPEEDAESTAGESADSAAEAISDNPRLWRALLFAHQPDRHGRCIACVSVRWPCGPRKLAERAEQLHRPH